MRPLFALLAVVAALGTGIAFAAFNSFAARSPQDPSASGHPSQAGTTAGAGNQGQGAGAANARTANSSAASNAGGNFQRGSSAAPPTRPWDATAPGIIIDPDLISRLDQALVGVDGHVGVAVKDLGSGRGAVLDGDTELQAASLYKLPVLDAVFSAGLSMSEELPITEEARSYDSGTMELGAGETLSVSEALERMITLSDNTSAVMLGGRLGSARVNQTIDALGLQTTHYSLERMTTSALDMLHLLEVVARGRAVTPAASADMVHLLLRQRVNDRLPKLMPDDVQIAHKTGNLPGVVNDVGILFGPNSTVAVAALVSDTDDETAAATAIARLGLAAHEYFEAQPEVDARPTIPPAPARPIPPVWREPRPVPTARPTVDVAPARTRQVGEPASAATPDVTAAPTHTVVGTPGTGAPLTVSPTPAGGAVTTTAQPTIAAPAKPTVAAGEPSPTASGAGAAGQGSTGPAGTGGSSTVAPAGPGAPSAGAGAGGGAAGPASAAVTATPSSAGGVTAPAPPGTSGAPGPAAPAVAKPTVAPTIAAPSAPPPTARPAAPAPTVAPTQPPPQQRPAANPTATPAPTTAARR